MCLIGGLAAATAVPARAQASKRQPGKRPAPAAKPAARQSAAFDDLSKRAAEAVAAKRFDEAISLYQQALQIRPDWIDGWWSIGTLLYDRDLYEQGREAFRVIVSLDVKNGPAWGLLGLCEFQVRDYERALVSLLRGRLYGLRGNAQLSSVVRYHAAILYTRFEHFEIAYDILREFLRDGNESPKVIEAFGLAMLRMPFLPNETPPDKREQVLLAGRAGFQMAARRLDEARQAFEALLSRYATAPNVHYAYGTYLLNQDADAALAEFKRELEISPSHVPSMLQMAFEYLKRKDYDTALPWAEKSVQLAPTLFPGRNVLGRVLLELGQNERAIKELEAGVRLAPDSPEMHYALARAYTRVGRREEAAREREEFQRLEKLTSAQRGAVQPLPGSSGPEDAPPKPKP
jgi:tetratricopeptide (TPR) repeat protein